MQECCRSLRRGIPQEDGDHNRRPLPRHYHQCRVSEYSRYSGGQAGGFGASSTGWPKRTEQISVGGESVQRDRWHMDDKRWSGF